MDKITFSKSISSSEHITLRESVGWKPIQPRQSKTGIKNSIFLTVAKVGEKTIGMTRAIGDGGYFLFLTEVIVHPEYQGLGIGRKMIEQFLEFAASATNEGERVVINLMSAEGKEKFYTNFGFIERPCDGHGAGMHMFIDKTAPTEKIT